VSSLSSNSSSSKSSVSSLSSQSSNSSSSISSNSSSQSSVSSNSSLSSSSVSSLSSASSLSSLSSLSSESSDSESSDSSDSSAEEQVDYLTQIHEALIDALESMSVVDGYNYDCGTTQEIDFAKVNNWPLYNVYLFENETTLEGKYHNMNSFRNVAKFEIRCYNKLDTEGTNSTFDIDDILSYMLHDIKKMIGENPSLSGIVDYVAYNKSEQRKSGQSENIMMPKYLAVTISITYSQQRIYPHLSELCF
jgi:hypothetical protein